VKKKFTRQAQERKVEREKEEQERREHLQREEAETLKHRADRLRQQQEREEQLRKVKQEREQARAKLRDTMRNQAKFGPSKGRYQERLRDELKSNFFKSGFGSRESTNVRSSHFGGSTDAASQSAEIKWDAFEAKAMSGYGITIDDIPFPDRAVLYVGSKDFKKLAMRWHPDKFRQRFGTKLDAAQTEDIMEKVKATFQQLNAAR